MVRPTRRRGRTPSAGPREPKSLIFRITESFRSPRGSGKLRRLAEETNVMAIFRTTLVLLAAAMVLSGVVGLSGCGDSAQGSGWDATRPQTITLGGMQGPDRVERAREQADRFARQTGLDAFWVADDGDRAVINFGRYTNESEADRDLEQLKRLALAGRFRPAMVALVPVDQPDSGETGKYDLRAVDIPDAIYTLQVGMYDAEYGADFREAAERAAAEYRAAGEEAYFYHGPRQSLVTIGIFGHPAARVIQEGPNRGQTEYHPIIRQQYQSKHPYAKHNGRRVPIDESGERFMPSFLVRIPGR